jgi:hypothetical protein
VDDVGLFGQGTLMIVMRTTSCSLHGHPEFQINYDPAIVKVKGDARWLVDWLEEAVARGERFTHGQTVQVGWGIAQVHAISDGALELQEPDMQQFPIAWAASVSQTLAHLRQQKDVCESVLTGNDLLFPSMLQSAIICTQLGKTREIVMERQVPSGSDSGWFCGCSGKDHDHNAISELRRVSLYEAAVCYALQIVPFLALPESVLLTAGRGAPTIFRHGEPLAFKPGSYLEARHREQ